MIECFPKDHRVTEQLRKCPLGAEINDFVRTIADLGYSPWTIRCQFGLLTNFIRWIQDHDIEISCIDDIITTRFLTESCSKRAIRMGYPKTLRRFLDHLQHQGLIPHPKPVVDDSPLAILQGHYGDYLRRERGLAMVTVSRYWSFIQRFLSERFGDGPINFKELGPQAIDDHLLRHAHESTPKVAQLMVSALRSFFRYLFRYGKTKQDLSTAIPTVPTWRFSDVPKYLRTHEIESILDTCNRRTRVGRRNYAILLLTARLGLRAGEAVAMELNDINWRSGELKVRGKGQFHDRLPLPQDVGEALADYLRNDRPLCSSRRVFIRARAPHRGFRGPTAVSTIVRRAVQKSGLNPPCKGAHLLRHSLATGMLREGASMQEIGELLRHRSVNSTEIYAKVDIEGLRSIARPWPEKGVQNE